MKRTISILAALCIGGLTAGAQSIADNESALRNSLWFSGDNAAALSIRPADIMGDLTINYGYESGALHLQQNPESLNDVSLHTSGSSKVGNLTVWGEFAFQNRFEEGARFNTLRYEVEDDSPYHVSDTCSSGWTKQAYLMSAKVASPLLWDCITFGMKVDYNTKVGAKQKDPRAATYRYNVKVCPSMTVNFGSSTVGLFGFFNNDFERSTPSLANYHVSQSVLLTTGLGEGTQAKVGDNDGLNTYYFKKKEFGAGVQYNWTADKADLFSEVVYTNTAEETIQSPGRPRPMGHIKRNTIDVELTGLFGEQRNHKVSVDADIRLTTGIEPTLQKPTAQNNAWVVITENNMMDMTKISAHALYDYMADKKADRYDWSAGADAWFSMRDYTHFVPMDTFSATSVLVMANFGKQLCKGASSVLLKAEAGYNLSLGGEYLFTGADKTARFQQQFVRDLAFLTSDYVKAGGRVSYTHKAGKVNYNLDLKAHYMMATGSDMNRIVATLSAGIIF